MSAPARPSSEPDADAPQVPAYRINDRQQVIVCPYCGGVHHHGLGDDPHRLAHCGRAGTVAARHGYMLVPATSDPPEWVTDLVSPSERPDEEPRAAEYLDDVAEHLAGELGILTRADLRNLPPISPLIDNTLDRGSLALLAGPWGSGKSLLALDWACSAATGHTWQGRAVHATDGPAQPSETPANIVLYVCAEGAYGLDARIDAWETARGTRVGGLLTLPRAVNLLARDDVEFVARFVRANDVDLVVFDTLSRCTPGGDENSAKDMSTVIRHGDEIRNISEVDTAVLLVHHTGKDGQTVRGSSVLEAACDTVYQTSGDAKRIQLNRTKRKDGPLPDAHTFTIQPVSGTDSVILSSGQVADDLANNPQRVLNMFRATFGATGASKADLRDAMKGVGMPSSSFHHAVNALVKTGILINKGTQRRAFYELHIP